MAAHIYVDESGSLADPRDTIVTLAAIKTGAPESLRWIIRRVRRETRRKQPKQSPPSELKFYTTTESIRIAVLEALAREKVAIYAVSVFKGAQIIPHTPINYAIMLSELLRACGVEHEPIAQIVLDSPFNTPQQRSQLTTAVRNALDLDTEFVYVDSRKSGQVQLADFVVGAIRARHMGGHWIPYQFIQPRMQSDRLVRWKTLRREWLEKDWRR